MFKGVFGTGIFQNHRDADQRLSWRDVAAMMSLHYKYRVPHQEKKDDNRQKYEP